MSIISSSAAADAGPLVPAKSGVAGVQSTAEAANFAQTHPASAEAEAPKYSSPKIYIDPRLHDVFYEYRDPDTGAKEYTIPAQSSRAYQDTQNQTQALVPNQTSSNQGQSQQDTGTGSQANPGANAAALAGAGASVAAAAQPAPAAPAQTSAPVSAPSVAPVSAPSSSGSSTLA